VLIYDAQYLPEEYEARRRGWGHSHWREAVNVVMESGAKELVFFHHDPDHTDAIIDKVVHEARNYYPKVRAAAEGMEIEAARFRTFQAVTKAVSHSGMKQNHQNIKTVASRELDICGPR
jgi:hypothetical protein